jgi:hypothetical protein
MPSSLPVWRVPLALSEGCWRRSGPRGNRPQAQEVLERAGLSNRNAQQMIARLRDRGLLYRPERGRLASTCPSARRLPAPICGARLTGDSGSSGEYSRQRRPDVTDPAQRNCDPLLQAKTEVWQPLSATPLIREDARQIVENMTGFVTLLISSGAGIRTLEPCG